MTLYNNIERFSVIYLNLNLLKLYMLKTFFIHSVCQFFLFMEKADLC